MHDPSDPSVQLIDGRPADLAQQNPIPGAVNIPFPTLRDNLHQIDKTRPVVTTCAFGKMCYFSARVLMQEGYDVRVFVGGNRIRP